MQLKVSIVLALCLVTVASADDPASFNAFGEPFNDAEIANIRKILSARVATMNANTPANTVCKGCLIDNWNQNYGHGVARKFPASELAKAVTGLPPQLANQVKSVVDANKGAFQFVGQAASVQTPAAHTFEYLGIVRRVGNNVELVMLKGEVRARLVKKFRPVAAKSCKQLMKMQCCCKEWVTQVPRNFAANEAALIEAAMRAEVVKRLKERALDVKF